MLTPSKAHSLFMQQHITREAWLLAAVEHLRPLFAAKGFAVPPCQVSCGFASTGTRSGHVGQCWSTKSASNELNQIFIAPTLKSAYDVIDTLVHELVHAVDNCENKHGKEFKKIALKMGMKGPMRSAEAGPELKATLTSLLDTLGEYPHGHLKVGMRKATRRDRPRAKCKHCGYQVPMLKKFLTYGPPICPKDKVEMEALGNWEEM
jgi:predicted Zn-ribbon and HTH transcriptional regulator